MDETHLISHLKRKEKTAFDYVFHLYYSSLCAFCLKYVDNEQVAEDTVQDFFVHFWLNITNLSIETSLKSYLFSSVRNRCLDYKKHCKIKEKHKDFIVKTTDELEHSTEHFLAESELRQALQSAKAKLTPRCREIFDYSRTEGLSNKEIAEKLHLSKNTVQLQISKALKVLREELSEFLPLYLVLIILQQTVL